VDTKNIEPYMPSLIENGAFMYSQICNIVKTIPKAILASKPLET